MDKRLSKLAKYEKLKRQIEAEALIERLINRNVEEKLSIQAKEFEEKMRQIDRELEEKMRQKDDKIRQLDDEIRQLDDKIE